MRKLQNKPFWAVLGVFFLASLLAIFYLNDSSRLTGNIAIYNIGFEKAGRELSFEVKDVKAVSEVKVALSAEVKNAQLVIEEIKMPRWKFEGVFFSGFRVSSSDSTLEAKLNEITFVLKLDEGELAKLGLKPAEVSLFLDGNKLPTERMEKRATIATDTPYLFYLVKSNKVFGDYAIGQASLPPVKPATPAVEEPSSLVKEAVAPPAETSEEKPSLQLPAPARKEPFWKKISRYFSVFRRD